VVSLQTQGSTASDYFAAVKGAPETLRSMVNNDSLFMSYPTLDSKRLWLNDSLKLHIRYIYFLGS
jgi:magnesium-transporting ATPase (P-type)